MEVNIHAAKTHFSKLLRRVAEGEEITIAKSGVPVARIVPIKTAERAVALGLARDQVKISDDFDSPLPAEILDPFYDTKKFFRSKKKAPRR
jgi:prevent-host-death family protein